MSIIDPQTKHLTHPSTSGIAKKISNTMTLTGCDLPCVTDLPLCAAHHCNAQSSEDGKIRHIAPHASRWMLQKYKTPHFYRPILHNKIRPIPQNMSASFGMHGSHDTDLSCHCSADCHFCCTVWSQSTDVTDVGLHYRQTDGRRARSRPTHKARTNARQIKQESLAVASIARDDTSLLPGMHRDHNALPS